MKKLRSVISALALAGVFMANAASAQPSWSFVMLGDTRDGDSTTNGVSTNLFTMAKKIASLNPRPQLVIVAGDLCNGNALYTNSGVYPPDGNLTNAAMKAVYARFFANWNCLDDFSGRHINQAHTCLS